MAFSINEFTNKFKDLARSYMFSCVLPTIAGINSYNIPVLIETTTLPTKTVADIEVTFMGQQSKYPGNVSYDNWTCTFRVDSEYNVYELMRTWMEIVRGDGNGFTGKWEDYKKEITIIPVDADSVKLGNLTLHGAFPTVLGEIAYDTKSSEVQTFQVTFAYDRHTWVL